MPTRTLIVVAARNEAERIGATLAALANAFPGAPVWVADDGSRDATAAVARGAGARLLSSRRPRGKGAAMSAAAAEALREARETPAAMGASGATGVQRAAGAASATGGAPAVFVLCDADLGESARELRTLARRRGERRGAGRGRRVREA